MNVPKVITTSLMLTVVCKRVLRKVSLIIIHSKIRSAKLHKAINSYQKNENIGD